MLVNLKIVEKKSIEKKKKRREGKGGKGREENYTRWKYRSTQRMQSIGEKVAV